MSDMMELISWRNDQSAKALAEVLDGDKISLSRKLEKIKALDTTEAEKMHLQLLAELNATIELKMHFDMIINGFHITTDPDKE